MTGWRCPSCGQSPELCQGYLAFAPEAAERNEGFRADYFEQLAQLEEHSFWFQSRNRLLTWALRRYFPRAESFLEIGCGTGFVLAGIGREFPGLNLSGSEIFTRGLTFATARLPGVSLFQMDARTIPFDAEFDVIGAFDVLEHIEEDQAVLCQMFQATKPGGGILVTVPQHRFLWSALDDYSFHKRRYVRQDLVRQVESAGFKVCRATSFVSLLLPLLLISRLGRSKTSVALDPAAELKINPILNRTLGKILGLERAVIRAGVSFPAGGSLLVVAQKAGV